MPVAGRQDFFQVWGYESMPTTRTVDNQLAQLRSALEDDPSEPQYLITVHGVGCRFDSVPAAVEL